MRLRSAHLRHPAALAGLLATGCSKTPEAQKGADKPATSKVKCEGANSCAGHGGCAGAGHECAGKNGCKGQGWVSKKTSDECTKAGGTVVKG